MAHDNASIFEELAPYARMTVVPGVTIGQMNYVNQSDLYSVGAFSSTAAGVVSANTEVQLFNAALFESAINQGFTAGSMTLNQTNSRFSKGQAPANQAFIATHAGFWLGKRVTGALDNTANLDLTVAGQEQLLTAGATPIAINAGTFDGVNDLFAVSQNFSWDLTIGRGITRTIGTLSEYIVPGSYAIEANDPVDALQIDGATALTSVVPVQHGSPCSTLKKLEVPIVFPPLVNVSISAKCGSPFQLLPQSQANVAVATGVTVGMVLRGYLMTMPVG